MDNTLVNTEKKKRIPNPAIDLYKEDFVGEQEPSSNKNPYEDALAKAKREQNYKAYYNTAIQLYNMKNKSNKYLQNELASKGLNTQGYGTSASASVNNQAINLYSENEQNYMNKEQEITSDAIDRYNSANEELDNQLITFIANSNGNQESINKYLTNYGYMEDGNFTDKWNNLNPERKAYIQSVIDGQSVETPNYSTYASLEALNNATYTNKKGQIETLGEHFSEESKLLWHHASIGDYKEGDSIKITNGEGSTIYMQWTKSGFKTISSAEYEKSNTQYALKGDKNKNLYTKVKG